MPYAWCVIIMDFMVLYGKMGEIGDLHDIQGINSKAKLEGTYRNQVVVRTTAQELTKNVHIRGVLGDIVYLFKHRYDLNKITRNVEGSLLT